MSILDFIPKNFNDTFDAYKILPGHLKIVDEASNSTTITRFSRPLIYITNITNVDVITKYIENNQTNIENIQNVLKYKTVDNFIMGLMLVNFAVCITVVALWILLLLQFLSLRRKPIILSIGTVWCAIIQTYAFTRLFSLMFDQFEDCVQDTKLMKKLIFDRIEIRVLLFISKIFIWINYWWIIQKIIERYRLFLKNKNKHNNEKPNFENGKQHELIGLKFVQIPIFIVVIFDIIMDGILHFGTLGDKYTSKSFEGWISITNLISTSAIYAIVAVFWLFFLLTKTQLKFLFKNFILILLIILFYVTGVGLNMLWVVNIGDNLRWLVGIYCMLDLMTIQLSYDLLYKLDEFNAKLESKGIIGREYVEVDADKESVVD